MILSMIGVFLITGWRGHFKNRSSLAHSHSMRHSYALLITGRRDHSEKSEASRRNVRPLSLGQGRFWPAVLRKFSEISLNLEPPMASALFSADHTTLVVTGQKPGGELRVVTNGGA